MQPFDIYQKYRNFVIQATASRISEADHSDSGKWLIALRIVNEETEKNMDVPFPLPPAEDAERTLRFAVAYAQAMIDRADPKLP